MTPLNRRQFLKLSATFGAGLVVGAALGCSRHVIFGARETSSRPGTGDEPMLGWLYMATDGSVVVSIPSSEMGQGVYTNLALLVAEELDVDFDRVQAAAAPLDKQFENPKMWGGQLTGGSTSTVGFWTPMREVGATARSLLILAAAKRWGLSAKDLKTASGMVMDKDGRKVSYGELVKEAAQLSAPGGIKLKDPSEFRLIGRSQPRVDTPAKVSGVAEFGMDVQRPGLVHAAVAQSPAFKGRVAGIGNRSEVEKLPGVISVLRFDRWVAVVAEHWWQAQRALNSLEVEFSVAGAPAPSSTDHRRDLLKALDQKGKAELSGEKMKVDVEYEVPFLEHATMSPMNCTAHVRPGACDVWAPTQAQSGSRKTAAKAAGLEPEQVQIHTTFLGGGFGRRAERDFVDQAVRISRAVKRPVKVIWSREETTQHGAYRPAVISRFQIALDKAGNPKRWSNQMALPNLLMQKQPKVPGVVWSMSGDVIALEGAKHPPYATGSRDVDTLHVELHTPLGFWRAVGHSHNGFFVESVVDELATVLKEDPAAFRRRHYGDHPRHRAVLDKVTAMAEWDRPRKKSHLGLAVHESFGTVVGQVVELSVSPDKEVTLHQVWCAVDCGLVVNPDTVAAQMESGIVYGLSAATRGEITLKDGAVEQSSFDDYPVMRMDEVPPIEVALLPGGKTPSGVGEPGLPPIAPAVANGIFQATGIRVRRLPFARAGFQHWRTSRV